MKRSGLHIAYVCGDRGVPIGGDKGASAHVAAMVRAFAAQGAEVEILGARVRDGFQTAELPAQVTDVGAQKASRRFRQDLFAGDSSAADRVNATESWGMTLNNVFTRSLERLHKSWRIDAIYERYSLWTYAGVAFAQQAGIPHFLEVNAPLLEEQRKYRGIENEGAAAGFRSIAFRRSDRILVPSAELCPYLLANGARRGAISVVPNAADPKHFHPSVRTAPRRTRATDPFTIGFLGSLKPWHGVDLMARAFIRLSRRHPNYNLLIVGEGPMRKTLEAEFRRERCIDRVRFTGAVAYEDVPKVVANMDVGLAPYPKQSDFYFSPIKIFEYMACGVPIVASDIGQIGDLMKNRKTARLHRPGAILEMASLIEEVAKSPTAADRMARQARKMLCSRFTWKRNGERVLSMMENAIKRGSRNGKG